MEIFHSQDPWSSVVSGSLVTPIKQQRGQPLLTLLTFYKWDLGTRLSFMEHSQGYVFVPDS